MRPTEQPDPTDLPPGQAGPRAGVPDDMARTLYDSRLDPDLSSATRSSTVTQLLVLGAADLSVELECFGSTVVGQVVPPARARIELMGRGRSANRALETDAVGGFVFDQGRGPFRLRARTGNGRTLQTQWLPATA